MIYTLTLNPAIDYVIGVSDFSEGIINKTERENIYAGGKGINVSTVLKSLGYESVALGFVAGTTGEMLENILDKSGIRTDFVRVVSGMTRINVKLSSMEKETEINGMGPAIGEVDMKALFERIGGLADEDILIMSGSIPVTISKSVYSDICSFLREKSCKAKVIIDTSAKEMTDTLQYKPLLVKPNHHELGALFDVEITTFSQAEEYGRKLIDMGAENVLVSMGEMGAVLIDKNGGCHRSQAPEGQVINSVGAGDTTVAAFVASLQNLQEKNYDNTVRYCVAAGSATAFSEGLAGREFIEEIYQKMP